MKLRDYQLAACHAVWDGWREKPRQLLVMATGVGKTVVGAALVWKRRDTGRCLWLAHRKELLGQAKDSLEACGLSVEIERADERASHLPFTSDVVVASVPTLHAGRLATWPPHAFSTIVTDECFPAGTMVGARPIESLRPGDEVPSYDERTGALCVSVVTAAWSRVPMGMVRMLQSDGGVVCCTPNHPFLTRRGWVPAGQLMPGDEVMRGRQDDMRSMRHGSGEGLPVPAAAALLQGVHRGSKGGAGLDEALGGRVLPLRQRGVSDRGARDERSDQGASLLLDRMPQGGTPGTIVAHDERDEPEVCLRPHEAEEPHAVGGGADEDVGDAQAHRACAEGPRRERPRADGAPGHAGPCAWPGVGDGARRQDQGSADCDAVSSRLQDRHRVSGPEGGGRGGRELSHAPHAPGAGREEGHLPQWSRVDRVEVLERGRDGTFGGVCRDGRVYNIEVARTHTYVVNGLIAHNCHHAVAKTWRAILDHFAADHLGRRVRVVGLSATPDRSDGIALREVFDEAAYRYELREAIADGWLVMPVPERVKCDDLDLGAVKMIARDLSASALDVHVQERGVLHQMAFPLFGKKQSELSDRIADRQVVIYMPGVGSAQAMEVLISGYERVGAGQVGLVTAETPSEKRQKILGAFEAGQLRVLINVMVLTEGWDAPSASVIVVVRATKSRSLLAQMIGRGSRVLREVDIDSYPTPEERRAAIAASSKPDCMVIDFTGRTEIRTATPADVLAGRDLPDDVHAMVKEALEEDPDRNLEDVLAEAEERAAESEAGKELEKRQARVEVVADYTTHPIWLVDFDERIEMLEDVRKAVRAARKRSCQVCGGSGSVTPQKVPRKCGVCKGTGRVKGTPYRNGEVIGPTAKQVALIASAGAQLPASAHIRQASEACGVIIARGLCSAKQADLLRRAGLKTNVSKSEASEAISAYIDAGRTVTAEIALRWGV